MMPLKLQNVSYLKKLYPNEVGSLVIHYVDPNNHNQTSCGIKLNNRWSIDLHRGSKATCKKCLSFFEKD